MLVLKVVNTVTFPGTWNLTENISKSQQHKKNGIYNEYNRMYDDTIPTSFPSQLFDLWNKLEFCCKLHCMLVMMRNGGDQLETGTL